MRLITKAIIHASATPPDMDIGVEEIRHWHADQKPKGRGWSDIGYHFVIRRSGKREVGRPIERAGAHAKGHNHDSVGICLVGGTNVKNRKKAEANFTLEQYKELDSLIADLQRTYGNLLVFGHRSFTDKKACPCHDVQALLGRNKDGTCTKSYCET